MALPYLHAQSCEQVSSARVTLTQRELTQAEKAESCGTTFKSKIAFYRVTPGALPGIFTVEYDAKTDKYTRVRFSKGNLQYLPASEEGDSVWRFAEHQYDYIGANNQYAPAALNHSVVKINNIDTKTDTLWFDLFGWGTSGMIPHDPARPESHPLSTNTDYNKYTAVSMTGSYYGYDWGVRKIFMGGDRDSLWRTLTKNQWNYLTFSRTATDGVSKLYCHGRIKIKDDSETYVNGLFIFPDGFIDIMDPDHPGKTLKTARGTQAYTTNTFTLTQWGALEKVGVVFLPAAGYRNGTIMSYVNGNGYYHASTTDGAHDAFNLNFSSGGAQVNDANYKNYGYSVRLVQDFTK